jgi:ankyrin repeat protein
MNDENTSQQLIDAIILNDTAAASSLISSGTVNLNTSPLPLHLAAGRACVEIMTTLLDGGADINAVDENQYTACHVAIHENQFEALKLLCERGANLGVVDCDGTSLITAAARQRKGTSMVVLLLDNGATVDQATTREDTMQLVKSVAVFKRLLARGVQLAKISDEYGRTLCHHVARNIAREDDLRVLVAACGNDGVNAADVLGETTSLGCVESQ